MGEDIPVIGVSGGPSAGKSKMLERLEKIFGGLGYVVRILREPATQLMLGGIHPSHDLHEFQRRVLSLCIQQEEDAKAELRDIPGPKIIFVDRPVMDGLAYIDIDSMRAIWDEFGHHPVLLRDLRYAGILYLESIAIGFPDRFNNKSNPTRYEKSPEEAAATCGRTLAAWIGCPHLAYIETCADFEEKVDRAVAWVRYFLGSVENERTYRLLIPFSPDMLPTHAQRVEIRQSYIGIPGKRGSARIRMRGQDGTYIYFKTLKADMRGISCDEFERQIEAADYARLYGTQLPGYAEIVKDRWCFVANGYYWELDVFRDLPDIVLLEVELPDPTWQAQLPPFLQGNVVEVTNNSRYANRELSQEIWRGKSLA